MAKTALPMLTLVNTLIQVRGRSQFHAGWFSVAVMRAKTVAPLATAHCPEGMKAALAQTGFNCSCRW